jgi:hypothetical protein
MSSSLDSMLEFRGGLNLAAFASLCSKSVSVSFGDLYVEMRIDALQNTGDSTSRERYLDVNAFHILETGMAPCFTPQAAGQRF